MCSSMRRGLNLWNMTLEQMRELANSKAGRRKHPDDEEHRIQSSCVRWFRLQYPSMRHNLFAVPNGGRRDKVSGAKLKAEGVLAGVADLALLKSNRFYGALLIEMKTRKGRQSEAQAGWQSLITKDGYKYVVCRSLDDFISEVRDYIRNL